MDLSERKKKILSAVIETNVKSKSADAVSSKQLHEEYLPKISSATIRVKRKMKMYSSIF